MVAGGGIEPQSHASYQHPPMPIFGLYSANISPSSKTVDQTQIDPI